MKKQSKILSEFISSIDKFNIDEQLDQNTGRLVSAKNLRWNYAEFYKL